MFKVTVGCITKHIYIIKKLFMILIIYINNNMKKCTDIFVLVILFKCIRNIYIDYNIALFDYFYHVLLYILIIFLMI